jgi:hypothetical protein
MGIINTQRITKIKIPLYMVEAKGLVVKYLAEI